MKPAGGKDAETLMVVMEGVKLRPQAHELLRGELSRVETNQDDTTRD